MLYEVLRHIRNFFPAEGKEMYGTFCIAEGTLELPSVLDGQYVLVEGSVLNDGVYQYPFYGLEDETFTGYIMPLAIPKDFLSLVDEIEAWQDKYGQTEALGPYSSESFGGYSYTRATNASGTSVGWKDTFKSRLNVWRKM